MPLLTATRRAFESVADPLLNLFFPQFCFSCSDVVESRRMGASCADCWAGSQLFSGRETLCNKCGAFLSEKPSKGMAECGLCSDHFYDVARAVGPYSGALRAEVIRLKSKPVLTATLAARITVAFERCNFPNVSAIMPVPLSKKRRLERGYNQADIVGRSLAAKTGIPFDGATLTRTAHSPIHRIAMDRKARELTVARAFAVVRPRLVKGASIVLVDDVLTSGSTASSCAKALKKSGADKVFVFTIARAV